MKTIKLLSISVALLLLGCQTTEKPELSTLVKQEKHKDGIFIHVSSGYDNPHKVSMALSLAVKMSETKDVTMFFDIKGVNVLTKTAEDIQMSNFMTLQSALDTLIQQNVQIMACPMCMAEAGIEPEQLKEGVLIAEAERFFNFTKGRILTLDY